MLIQGSSNSEKTKLLAKKYVELKTEGIKDDEILIIVLNPYKKSVLIDEISKIDKNISSEIKSITTFWGLCYRTFKENWKYISSLIGANYGIEPNLCGLEVSQYIFKRGIKEVDFSDYISKINLLHQLFRRYSLIVQNCLTPKEVRERSLILKESFYKEAQKAIEDYKIKTNNYKSFDYLRQLAVLPLIYQNTDYFKKIKYILIDDADEYSYAFWCFVDNIMPQIHDYLICYDKDGSSRYGYLCAYKSGINDFIKKYNPKLLVLKDKSPYYNIAQKLYENIKNGKRTRLDSFAFKNFINRLDMFEEVKNEINSLINSGIKPNEIAIITPLTDEVLIHEFSNNSSDIQYQILSGSEKLIDCDSVKNILSVMKLTVNMELKEYELKNLLINLLNIPYKKCLSVINDYKEVRELKSYKFENEKYDFSYTKLLSVIQALKKSKKSITEVIKIIYTNLIVQVQNDKAKYDFLLREAESFESAFQGSIENPVQEFIVQIQNSVISENPSEIVYINKKKVIISTPQKLIDYSLKTKYQIWVDISVNEWLKQDTGTLYNSWVFNRDWEKDEYTLEDNINLTRDKAGRIVRKLMLLVTGSVSFYSSMYDTSLTENFGGLNDYIEVNGTKTEGIKIVARDDQKPVLEYKRGKMGVMAVPGAGKTTILLALVLKLIQTGIKPENIFVLTYMESAAKNFKERLKNILSDIPVLPNISTIHGLALRIIKENANYTKIALDENFEIIDDAQKERLIKELFYNLKIDEEKYDNYLRCISLVKLTDKSIRKEVKYKEINDFYNFFKEYNKVLRQGNMIDYDDMLCFAIKILKENPSILEYYQEICKYIIEDEAQDSTEIQQVLLNLLSGKYNNLVRCGDINQAITSTFTDSKPEEFLKFAQCNKKVEMTTSQRCAKEIFTCANNLINNTLKDINLENTFYNIQIKGTDNNPLCEHVPEYLLFDTENEEKSYILNKIRSIKEKNPNISIAILLRLNHQVNEYSEYLQSEGIKNITRGDCAIQTPIYRIILEVLKTIQNPLNNSQIISLAKAYLQNGISEFKEADFTFLNSLKEPFINLNIDDIESQNLSQLYWDIDYMLNNSAKPIDVNVLNIGLYYSKNNIDKANTNLAMSVIRRLKSDKVDNAEIIKQFEYVLSKPSSNSKFPQSEIENNENPINIMTVHKSKGDEFDIVFCPMMNEENYPITKEHVKLKSGGHFVQTIKNIETSCSIKQPESLKQEQIHETLRLLYVAITRAKKGLIFTNSRNYKKRKNTNKLDLLDTLLSKK